MSDYWKMTPEQRERRREQMREYARARRPEQARRDAARIRVQVSTRSQRAHGICQQVKDYVISRKIAAGECVDCSLPCEEWNHVMFAYDHLDRTQKLFAISKAYKMKDVSFNLLEAEIAKCELVCHNCHAFRTWVERAHDPTVRQATINELPLMELMTQA
jgi:hypothetical protein